MSTDDTKAPRGPRTMYVIKGRDPLKQLADRILWSAFTPRHLRDAQPYVPGAGKAKAALRAKEARAAQATPEATAPRKTLPTTQWGKPASDDGAGVGIVRGTLGPPPNNPKT